MLCYKQLLVLFQVDLQTSNRRVALVPKMEEANATLGSGEHLGQVVSHEINEQGQHMLDFFFKVDF